MVALLPSVVTQNQKEVLCMKEQVRLCSNKSLFTKTGCQQAASHSQPTLTQTQQLLTFCNICSHHVLYMQFWVFLCFPEPSENKLQTSIHNSQNKNTLLLSQGLVTNYIRQDSNGNKTSRRYIYLYIYICIFTGEFNFRHVVRKKNPGSISYMPS